jgi:hypothetical protein
MLSSRGSCIGSGGACMCVGGALLMVYIRIKVQVDLQADKSSVVVKGPFFPQV